MIEPPEPHGSLPTRSLPDSGTRRTVSRAAEKLFRTQSAVSQTIQKLEDELGEPLFDRSSREGVLTDAGNRAEGLCGKATESSRSMRRRPSSNFASCRKASLRWQPTNLPCSTCCRCSESSAACTR